MKFERVFGIGCGKTGTTSLTSALEILGYTPAIHFPREKHMQDIYDGKYKAATDTPVALHFREIYNYHPDAAYILTIREIESWLKSIETHMTVGKGKYGLNNKWVTKMRTDLYKGRYFDRNVYKESYNRHISEVITFFAERNKLDNLLIVNLIEEKLPWVPLCEFLNIRIPSQDFPHGNKGQYDKVVKNTELNDEISKFERGFKRELSL